MDIAIPVNLTSGNFRDFLLLYLIIFLSGDTFLCGTNSNDTVLTTARILLIACCLIIICRMRLKVRISNNICRITAYSVLVSAFIIIAIINHENINRVGIKLICMTAAFLLSILWSFRRFVENYNKVMCFISITAIAFTLLAYLDPNIVKSFPFIINTANARIFTCGLAGILEGCLDSWAIRTSGIFWEPGVFQIYLNLAIAFELLNKESFNSRYLCIFLIALFLTFSTTGYIVCAWIICTYFLFIKKITGHIEIKRFFFIIVVFLIVFILLQYTDISNVVFAKIFDKSNINYGSTTTRMAGVLVSCKIALDHPWHGVGMMKMKEEFLRLAIQYRVILGGWTHDNTNTFFYQFAAYGIPFGLFFACGTYKYGYCVAKGKNTIAVAVFIMLLLMYIGENLQYSIFPYLIVFYGYGWKESIKTCEDIALSLAVQSER